MTTQLGGIHHITAIAGDPQANIEFYTNVLGLRLVKLTVNYDDPGTYHLYYGDTAGTPGSILTFFPFPGAQPGRPGTGQVTVIAFSIPSDAVGFWAERLARKGIEIENSFTRFDEEVLSFRDPDGLPLELVASKKSDSRQAWNHRSIPIHLAIRGIYSATISQAGYESTARLLTDTMGFRLIRERENRFRYEISSGGASRIVDVLCLPDGPTQRPGVGTVHHIAWRSSDDQQHREWRSKIANLSYNVTPIIDRTYFRSIYFREPGGVLFEIATDAPGFTVNESADKLVTRIMLPPWLESRRKMIEESLPTLRLPGT